MTVRAATATLDEARAHARAQGGAAATSRVVPATAATDLPTGVEPADVLWDEVLPVGGHTSLLLPRGGRLRLSDTEGDACVQLSANVAARPWERLNVADTVKVQWQAYLGPGAVLLSDMGRVLLTIVADTSARHDCLCGASHRRGMEERHGDGAIGGPTPNGRDLLALAAAKQGLARIDVPTPVDLFKSVRVDAAGALHLDGDLAPGTMVELRAEQDVVVLLAATPHPLDDRPGYHGSPVRCTAWRGPVPGPDDEARRSSPERTRAFENTDEVLRSAPWTS